jgi:hypothetical protein
MNFLARLATGDIALWRAFWLIGMPLALIWDVSLACMVAGIGIEQPFITGFIIALFTLASTAILLAAVAIWRSASRYPREAWWQTPLAWGAKLCAAFSGLTAVLSLLGICYLAFTYIYATFIQV